MIIHVLLIKISTKSLTTNAGHATAWAVPYAVAFKLTKQCRVWATGILRDKLWVDQRQTTDTARQVGQVGMYTCYPVWGIRETDNLQNTYLTWHSCVHVTCCKGVQHHLCVHSMCECVHMCTYEWVELGGWRLCMWSWSGQSHQSVYPLGRVG